MLVSAALAPVASANATKYFYDGQHKTPGVKSSLGGVVELAYDKNGNRTERTSAADLITPRLIDSTLLLDIRADIHRVYFLWGDGRRDAWENSESDRNLPRTFTHDYQWNGDFLCQIYFISKAGERKHYTTRITISGL